MKRLFWRHLAFLPALLFTSPAPAADLALVLERPREVRLFAAGETPARQIGRRADIERPVRTLPGAVPLAAVPGHESLYAAYMAQFLDCASTQDGLEERERWVRRQVLGRTGAERAWEMMALPLDRELILVASANGQKAVILQRATGKRLAGTACGASGALLRVSPNRRRIALVSKEITIRFPATGATVQWEGQFTGQQAVQIIELAPSVRIAALVGTDENVLDVHLPDSGNWQVLTAHDGSAWWKPSNWLRAFGGQSTRRSSARLRTFDEQGGESGVQVLASGVVLGSAWFCPQPGCPMEPR